MAAPTATGAPHVRTTQQHAAEGSYAPHAKLAAAALVSKSVRKSVDFNCSSDYQNANVGQVDTYPDVSRNRGSLADYTAIVGAGGGGGGGSGGTGGAGAELSATNKRSSFAGTPTSRTEFILSINPPTFTASLPSRFDPPAAPSATSVNQQLTASNSSNNRDVLESSHGSLSSLAHRDSLTSSKGSLFSEDRSPSDQVMTRIKKSFEQKEEFLKRPALPYWVNSEVQSPPIPKEFYAQPQKFARPLWPPNTSSSQESLLDASKETATVTTQAKTTPDAKQPATVSIRTEVTNLPAITSVEPWSLVFTSTKPAVVAVTSSSGSSSSASSSTTTVTAASPPSSPGSYPPLLGLVPNTVPKPFYGSNSPSGSNGRIFVSTLTRIQENIPCDPMANERRDLDLKLKQSLHAPLASPEEFTPSPTKSSGHPLARSGADPAHAGAVPESVCKRAKQFEMRPLLLDSAEQKAVQACAIASRKSEPAHEPVPAARSGSISLSFRAVATNMLIHCSVLSLLPLPSY